MKCLFRLLALSLIIVVSFQAEAKEKYNLWAKERVRYLYQKVQRDPYNAGLRLRLATAYHADGQYYEAISHLNEAIRLNPNFAEAHCNLGIILHAQSQLPQARKHYERALELDCNLIEARAGLGTLLCRTQHQAEGLRHLEQVLQVDPKRDKARFNLAVAYHKSGDFKQSISHLEILLKRAPGYPGGTEALAQSYYSHGVILLQAQKPGEALEVLEKALANKEEENFLFAKGLAHLRQEDYQNAEIAFLKVVELQADHVPALHNLASLYERDNRLEKAALYYRKVQKLVPHMKNIEAARNAKYDVEFLIK